MQHSPSQRQQTQPRHRDRRRTGDAHTAMRTLTLVGDRAVTKSLSPATSTSSPWVCLPDPSLPDRPPSCSADQLTARDSTCGRGWNRWQRRCRCGAVSRSCLATARGAYATLLRRRRSSSCTGAASSHWWVAPTAEAAGQASWPNTLRHWRSSTEPCLPSSTRRSRGRGA